MENTFTTTFWQDFSIADLTLQLKRKEQNNFNVFKFEAVEPNSQNKEKKLSWIKDTFERCFEEWKNDYKYLTDLVMVTNHKSWQWYEYDEDITKLYIKLYEQADQYAINNLKGDELRYFLEVTD